MSKKKSIAVAVVLLLVLLIGGMLAYFTDTDSKTNVFTLGDDIEISLTETNWDTTDANGNNVPDAAEKIHPNATIAKNPVINNDSTTTPAYVFAEVIVPLYDSNNDGTKDAPLFKLNSGTTTPTALGTTVGDSGNSGWTLISVDTATHANSVTYVYAYGSSSAMTSLAKSTSTSTAVFDSVTLEPSLTAAQKTTAASSDIIVNAYGIQTDSLSVTAPTAIYALFNN